MKILRRFKPATQECLVSLAVVLTQMTLFCYAVGMLVYSIAVTGQLLVAGLGPYVSVTIPDLILVAVVAIGLNLACLGDGTMHGTDQYIRSGCSLDISWMRTAWFVMPFHALVTVLACSYCREHQSLLLIPCALASACASGFVAQFLCSALLVTWKCPDRQSMDFGAHRA